ncbi:MAG: glucosidase, partial [Anaerolineae bacterium]|nr:glucosidase [Anaerolineae bacterium]
YFPHDHARSRAYRWNEDGLAGISDRNQYLCFALALWNGRDPFLKERLFGLAGAQGNHGEDVKEYYFYLDSTPTHSYMKFLYKYPQAAFPYARLVAENARRGFDDDEFELLDTGVFAGDRYFDVLVEYAKAAQDDILIRIHATNRGPQAAPCHILPTLWFRNTWAWGYPDGPMHDVSGKPTFQAMEARHDVRAVLADHPALGTYYCYAEDAADLLFTENETNMRLLYDSPNASPYVKDAFHRCLVDGEAEAVNPEHAGTKVAAVYRGAISPGRTRVVHLRLSTVAHSAPFADCEAIFRQRIAEADAFYAAVQNPALGDDERRVQRQAFAGMLWSKQLYTYDVEQWLNGDPAFPPPPAARWQGRNHEWRHLSAFDPISMPDKWEYPWFAAWDLAFHCLPLALVDPDFTKRQLELITREWYMHPNGELPAFEWSFGDANPPVHAWAAWRVYKITGRVTGQHDHAWLMGIYHKLLLNFTWWVNRKDMDGNNVFQGGFLGLDNISLFNRDDIPLDGRIDQSDGTAWMAFYALGMMRIALELARHEPVYQDLASKFYEHFLAIARAMTDCGGLGHALWDPEDGFFYDALHLPDGTIKPLRVRSLVGLIPLLAVETLEPALLNRMSDFTRRMNWFTDNRPQLSGSMASIHVPGEGQRILTAILTEDRLRSVLRYMLDEDEFLSLYGIRSLSKVHATESYTLAVDGQMFSIDYEPGESRTGLFGGNSNWRGPVWFPINYLIIEALQKFHHYYGDTFTVEMPTGSGQRMTLREVATELSRRLERLFLRGANGRRPIYGDTAIFQHDPHWRDLILFHEYFHGDNGTGLGASHQTGWTGLVAKLIQQSGGGPERK